jgi:transcriptional regulator with GAF, ATPase, and Fis domain
MVLLTERCVDLLDASAAGLLLANGDGRLRVIAATSEATGTVELFEAQNDEGPCRDCFHSGKPVNVADLPSEAARWPRFSPVAASAGFRAAHALPLRLRGQVLGALNLFRAEPSPLSRTDLATGQALADVATISLVESRALRDVQAVAEQLEEALNSRTAVEQAKGVLAERQGIGMDEAFSRLRAFARGRQRRLTDVALEVVAGTLPADQLRDRA